LFIVGLILSGLTAIPISATFDAAASLLGNNFRANGNVPEFVAEWLRTVSGGVHQIDKAAPYFYYGTDWLAFGHIVIALSFVGAWRDPVRNRWLYQFGMMACILVVPWAAAFGAIRGIPVWWRIIDCSFGVFGFFPVWFCHRRVCAIENRMRVAPTTDNI
jgi:hypothetical protein